VPARDNTLIRLIAKVLEKNPGLGRNQLYKDLTPLYGEKKGLTKLSKPHSSKYLGLMIRDGLVERLGGEARGKPVELYLTEIGKTQYHQNSLDLPSLRGETQIFSMKDGIPQELKALYAIILYFNQGLNYIVRTEDALKYILREFGLSMSSLIIRSEGIVQSDLAEIRQVIFQSPKKDAMVYKDAFFSK
jgi:DNA-binding MarR family transcriptional regulator